MIMKTTKKVLMAICLTAIAIMAASCSTPTNIVYFQDLGDSSVLEPANAEPIRFQPMDKLSIIVTSRDPQVSAMFNLPVYTGRIGENQSLTADSGIGSRMTTGGSGSISGYTVNSEGNIDFPIIGSIHIAGLTREEAEGYIKRIDRNKRVLVCITGVAVVMLSYIHPKYLEPIEAPSQEQKQENTI